MIPQTSCEHIFVKIKIDHLDIILGAIYIPQNVQYDSSIYSQFTLVVDELKINYPESHLCLFGDFNLPNVSWSNGDSLYFDTLCTIPGTLINSADTLIDSLSLYNHKHIFPPHPTKKYTLDLLFTSLDFSTSVPIEPLMSIDPDHPPMLFNLKNDNPSSENFQPTQFYYNFKNLDYDRINAQIAELLPSFLELDGDIDLVTENFYTLINDIINVNVPKIPLYHSNFPRWYNNELKRLIVLKKVSHRKWKATNELDYLIEFRKLRATCLRRSKFLEREYNSKVEDNITKDPKFFWNHFNSLRKPDPAPASMRYNDTNSNNPSDFSNLFKLFFESVYSTQSVFPEPSVFESDSTIRPFTLSEVQTSINNLNNSFENRIDAIPATFIKNSPPISSLLHHIFNLSLKYKTVRARFKR